MNQAASVRDDLPLGRIVIAVGSGRSGTASLTSLIDRQPGAICFHERNPSCAVFEVNPQSQVNAVREFEQIVAGGDLSRLPIDYSRQFSVQTYKKLQQIKQVDLIADIAFYYLNYVDELLVAAPESVVIYMKRERESTISSWLKKSAIKRWPSLWLADRLQRKHPERFRIFDVRDLSSDEGQKAILSFLGIAEQSMVCCEEVHLHRSSGNRAGKAASIYYAESFGRAACVLQLF